MTREEVKELLPIMQAFADGKKIEYSNDGEDWIETETPTWDTDYVYRIKLEQTYRPFKNQEECCQEMLKHQPFGWIRSTMSGNWYMIESISNDIYFDRTFIPYDVAFECSEFIDGTPFGIKEE